MDATADLLDEREVLTRFKAGRLERAQAVRILTALMSATSPQQHDPRPHRTSGTQPAAAPGLPDPARTAPAPVLSARNAPALAARTATASALATRTAPAPATTPGTVAAPAATPAAPPSAAPAPQAAPDPARTDADAGAGGDGSGADLDRYAVVGIAGRYPGAGDLHTYWQNLREGRDTSSTGPLERPGGSPLGPGRRGHFLDRVAEFDAEFFGLDPVRAALMDPQARLFQEVVWEALEDAGCTGSRLDALTGSDGSPRAVGVFAGVSSADYALLAAHRWTPGRPMPASGHGDLAAHLAARLRLSGPAQAVDSAGTSALAAVHLAVGALRRGECAAAVAGGVELLLHPARGRDSAGEGIGALVLKPLARALADGDQIHAVLRHPAPAPPAAPAPPVPPASSAPPVSCGRAASTAPAPVSAPVVRETYESTVRRIGDAGAATGIAALTSAVLQVRAAVLAPAPGRPAATAWPRPHDPDGTALPRTALVDLAPAHGPRLTAVLEEFPPPRPHPAPTAPRSAPAPTQEQEQERQQAQEREKAEAQKRERGQERAARQELVLLSAPTPAHLTALAARLADWIAPAAAPPATEPQTPPAAGAAPAAVPALAELARTLRTGRAALPCRLALTVTGLPQLHATLTAFAADPHAAHDGRIRAADLRTAAHDPYALAGVPETGDYLAALWHAGRLEQVTRLWLSGLPVDWAALEARAGAGAMVVPLPPSPFLRRPLWLEDTHPTAAPADEAGRAGAAGETS